jgi:hypothetical protein
MIWLRRQLDIMLAGYDDFREWHPRTLGFLRGLFCGICLTVAAFAVWRILK